MGVKIYYDLADILAKYQELVANYLFLWNIR